MYKRQVLDTRASTCRTVKAVSPSQYLSLIHIFTDGEFRRSYWHLDFMWGLGGIEHVELDHGYFFVGEETTHGSAVLTGKISGENHPFVEHFKFVQALEELSLIHI